MTGDEIIQRLQLQPHPEGGHYRQTWRAGTDGRGHATAIYFLLRSGESSHWHTVDADELWLYHAGAPLCLSLSADADGPAHEHHLGPDLATAAPQVLVPAQHWQSARTTGDWTLVSCIVAPGFMFDGFTLAAPEFEIPPA